MKEWRVQVWAVVGQKWLTLHECYKKPFASREIAERSLSDHQAEHPENRYRLVSRDVTEWEEVS